MIANAFLFLAIGIVFKLKSAGSSPFAGTLSKPRSSLTNRAYALIAQVV